MGLLERAACFFGWHEWDTYQDYARGYALLHCPYCGCVSTPLNGKPTKARKPSFTEEVFLQNNFVGTRRRP
jgi:hypothetical protein